jgi:hypothetical protein
MNRIMKAGLTLALVAALGVLFTHDAAAQQKGTGTGKRSTQFVDQNGDGVCDNFGTKTGQHMGNSAQGKGYGPGNGTGNMGVGPKDGTGYGAKTGTCNGTGVCTGSGVCDGSGAQGSQMQRGKR